MTDPRDPGDDDWGFPEVDPASTELPSSPDEEQAFDTGSDAWWRAQAEAQRRAAAADPVVPPAAPPAPPEPVAPPELVEPEVLNAPSPLDEDWLPPELPELRPPVVEIPVEDADWDDSPHDEDAWDDSATAYPADDTGELPAVVDEPQRGPDWYRGLVAPDVTEPMPEEVPAAEATADTVDRAPYEPGKVGPGRALAGAAIALAGVVLGIGALFVLGDDGEPTGGPVVVPPSATPSATRSAAPSAEPTTVTTSAPAVVTTTPPVAQAPLVPVRVLNNSKITGLADRAAQRFRAGGWTVPQTGNYRGGTIAVTTVYYDTGQQASAERFAKQFGIPRVAPRFPGIPVPGMTVIVTRDYQP